MTDLTNIEQRLKTLSKKEVIDLLQKAKALEKKLAANGPRNDDELHHWIKTNLGVHVPRNAVCEHHNAPFQFIADLYFERTGSALLMANRGGSKTWSVAVLHLLNSLFKPGIESATVGAIEMQARRAYMHLQKLLEQYGRDQVAAAIMSETRFKNGSRVEILPGTVASVNGPHPQKVHADEVELMDPEVFDESRNMSQGAIINGRHVKAQDIITSTRKRGHGQMQRLLDEIDTAKINGATPPYELYQWCCFESAAKVPNCQVAKPELEGDDRCPCHDVIKGTWEDGTPRSLKSICRGRLHNADGWVPLVDLINTFTKTSQSIWEAQQECIKPSLEGLVVPQFSRERHGIRGYEPLPEYGPIYMSVDFGGTNPHAVNWYQVLKHEIEVKRFDGTARRLPDRTIVCFSEIYRAEIGNVKLARLTVERELMYRKKYGKHWRVHKRFADPAAKAARLDWAKNSPALPTVYRVTREIPEHIKLVVNLAEDDMMFVDVDACPMWCEEIEAWHYPPKKPDMEYDPEVPVDDFNHCMSNLRYAVANIASLERNLGKFKGVPLAGTKRHGTAALRTANSLPATAGGKVPMSETWRARLGGPLGG